MTSAAGDLRRGYTAVELMLVISVLAALASMATMGVLAMLRNQALLDAANGIERVAMVARDLANRAAVINSVPSAQDAGFEAKRYGVVLQPGENGSSPWVALTWGAEASPATILLNANGSPALRVDLPATLHLASVAEGGGTSRLDAALGWMFQHGNGTTTAHASTGAALGYIGHAADLGPLAGSTEVEAIAEPIEMLVPGGGTPFILRVLPSGEVLIAKP